MKLGLAVSSGTLAGVADTTVLLQAAAELGVDARLIDWRSTGWDWPDAVLLHAPWDYTQDLQAFTGWLQTLSERTPVFNPYDRAVLTTHKSYLLDLAAAGIPVPLTRLLPSGQAIDADDLQATFGTSAVVAKPAVGAGGRGMSHLASVGHLAADPLVGAEGVPSEDVLVQAFVPSVQSQGEHSLVMIAGKPSHLIRKTPAAGQYRVQASYGGTELRVDLDTTAATVAQLVRSHVQGLAYARVDYVAGDDGQPLLMELELTEPDLFLRHHPPAARTLVQHLCR